MLEIESITEDERTKVEELKERIDHEITPLMREDKTLYYRVLKSRDFNVKQSEALIRKQIADRKFYNFEEILKAYNPPEHIYQYFPFSFLGYDKEGAAVRYVDFGKADHRGLVTMYSFAEIANFVAVNLEEDIRRMTDQSIKLGKSVTKFTVILNMDKLSLLQATFKKGIEFMMKGFELYQDNYPERIKSVYVINTSFYFYMGYSIVKTILSSGIQQKIRIFGTEGWKEALLENIDAEVLPAFLGGTRTDPDGNPLCETVVVLGKKIPDNLYAKKKRTIVGENGVKKLTIRRFSKSEITLNIYEEGTRIEWEFETKNKDIGFGLYYRDSAAIDNKMEELIPKQRIDTMLSAEAGIYKCEKIGMYIIVFDNTYSWVHSKELYYRTKLVKPNKCNSLFN